MQTVAGFVVVVAVIKELQMKSPMWEEYLRTTFRLQEVLKSLASQVYVLISSGVQPCIISFLTLPSATISYFLLLRISVPFLNHFTLAFSLDTSHSRMAVASSSTVWSSRGLVNSTGGSERITLIRQGSFPFLLRESEHLLNFLLKLPGLFLFLNCFCKSWFHLDAFL